MEISFKTFMVFKVEDIDILGNNEFEKKKT